MTAKLQRHRNQMFLMVVLLGLVFTATAGLIVSHVMHAERVSAPALSADQTATPIAQQQPLPAAIADVQTSPGVSPQQQPRAAVPEENNSASRSAASSIDPNAVQNALTTLAQNGKQRNLSPQKQPASSGASAGSDRYPGSQPIEVKDVNLPDIGVPVSSEVYTTSDSLSTVVSYYSERYSDAEVMEVNGQKVIAVDRPGAAKVIAIGTSGQETRIAIVKQAN
jgi:hypothetical protein